MANKAAVLKYRKVAAWMREKIASNRWPIGEKLPNEVTLAKKLRVSTGTIERALRELVQGGLIVRRKKSGTFVSDPRKPPLIKGRNLHIGLLAYHSVTGELSRPGFTSEIVQGIVRSLGIENKSPDYSLSKARNASLALWQQPDQGIRVQCVGPYPGVSMRHPDFKAIKNAGYDALFSIGIIENDFLDKVLGLGIPTSIIDYPSQVYKVRSDMVYADPDHGYLRAIECFLEQGLRNIHFIGSRIWNPNALKWENGGYKRVHGRRADPDSYLRLNACRYAFDAVGLELPESRVHFVTGDVADREALFEKLVALPEQERPEAILCQDAVTADGFIEAFAGRGLKLQGAGGCSGFHYGQSIGIQVDTLQMGRTAAELLLDRLKKPESPFVNVGIRMKADEHQLSSQHEMGLVSV